MPTGVLLKASVKGLPPGEHAFHIHAVGAIRPSIPQAAISSDGKKHGLMAPEGHHAGDMPNFTFSSGGALGRSAGFPAMTLEQGKPNSVFGPNGTAIVIHAGVDDYKTDPTGNRLRLQVALALRRGVSAGTSAVSTAGNRISRDRNGWLPFLDTYRTTCWAPEPAFRADFLRTFELFASPPD